MVKIELTRGKFAIVDNSHAYLARYKWHISAKKYAARDERMINGCKGKRIYMHRQILDAKQGECVDHINHNTLDNRLSNLRICTHQQNLSNQSLSQASTTRFKGVHLSKEKGRVKRFVAYIKVKQVRRVIGYYLTAIEAARAYNDAAKKSFGEFAYLNKV